MRSSSFLLYVLTVLCDLTACKWVGWRGRERKPGGETRRRVGKAKRHTDDGSREIGWLTIS